jgi:PAS domain S-box-containing protein
MNETKILKEELQRERSARKKLENLLETKTQELYVANKKLEEEINKATNYLDILGVMIVAVDINQNVTLINKKGCEILGYRKEEIIGKNWFDDFIPENIKEEVKNVFLKLLNGEVKSVEYFENPVLTKNDEEKIILWHNTVLKNDNGEIIGTLSSGDDITERKKIEKELHDRENKYRTLLENLPQKIFFKDKNSVYISCNENYARDLNIMTDEIAGKTDYDFYPKELAEKYRADDKRIMESNKIEDIEEEYIQDGEKVFVHTVKTPIKDEVGNVCGLLGIFWDITKHKKADEALLYEHNLFQTLLDNFPDSIYFKDKDARFVRISKSVAELFNTNIEDIIGKTDNDFFLKESAEEVFGDDIRIIKTGKPIINKEEIIIAMNGKKWWASTTKLPWYDKDGNIIGMFGISRDMSNLKQLEDDLKERIKELNGLFTLGKLAEQCKDIDELIIQFVRNVIPPSLRFPDKSIVTLEMDGKKYSNLDKIDFYNCDKCSSFPIIIKGEKRGELSVCYMEDLSFIENFEYNLLEAYTGRIGRIIEKIEIEKTLIESEERFRLVFENAGDGILIADAKTKIFISANKKICELTGYSLSEILTLGVEDIHPKEEFPRIIKGFEKLVRGEITLTPDIPILKKDGTVFYADIGAKPIIMNRLNCLVGIFRDITERKKLEEEKSKRDKLEAINNMIVTLNHEMNQHISIIISYSDYLMKGVDEKNQIYGDVKLISDESWKLANLIKKIGKLKEIKTTEYSKGVDMIDLNNIDN